MGPFANSLWVKVTAWAVAIVIAGLNVYLLPTLARLLWQTFAG
jgi:Mn2+/Fe2+ NRAMP family transporter